MKVDGHSHALISSEVPVMSEAEVDKFYGDMTSIVKNYLPQKRDQRPTASRSLQGRVSGRSAPLFNYTDNSINILSGNDNSRRTVVHRGHSSRRKQKEDADEKREEMSKQARILFGILASVGLFVTIYKWGKGEGQYRTGVGEDIKKVRKYENLSDLQKKNPQDQRLHEMVSIKNRVKSLLDQIRAQANWQRAGLAGIVAGAVLGLGAVAVNSVPLLFVGGGTAVVSGCVLLFRYGIDRSLNRDIEKRAQNIHNELTSREREEERRKEARVEQLQASLAPQQPPQNPYYVPPEGPREGVEHLPPPPPYDPTPQHAFS